MNDLEQRVKHLLDHGLSREDGSWDTVMLLLDEHIALKESTRLVQSATMDSHNRILGELKEARYELGVLRKGIEANAIEAAKVPWWRKWWG